MERNVYPLLMTPALRPMVWGGSCVQTLYGKAGGRGIGEYWEISIQKDAPSRIRNGALRGKTLQEAIEQWGQELTGRYGTIDLLIKILDAKDNLSVQVHPDNAYARQKGGSLGKTEAWVVLYAPEGAQLVYGLKTGTSREMLEEALTKGSRIEDLLRWTTVQTGDVLYIPHGHIHAIGEGIVLYEVQQSSDITYRLWDWERKDAQGNMRELHKQEALDVIKLDAPASHSSYIEIKENTMEKLLSTEYFHLSRLHIQGEMIMHSEPHSAQLFTALGDGCIVFEGGSTGFYAGDSFIIPSAMGVYCLKGSCDLLLSCEPQ